MKDQKAEALEQILEAERQVMLWEKKMQLERETQVREVLLYQEPLLLGRRSLACSCTPLLSFYAPSFRHQFD